MFFRHDLERILPYVETISLTLEEESQGLRQMSRSRLEDHCSILIVNMVSYEH